MVKDKLERCCCNGGGVLVSYCNGAKVNESKMPEWQTPDS